jgi:hypothetical protein
MVRGHHLEETETVAGIIGYRGSETTTGKTWYNHMPAAVIRDRVGQAIWNDYFKFCGIRNPFDKLVSYWWFVMAPEERRLHQQQDFEEIRSIFSKWAVAYSPTVADRHTYMIDGSVCVDFFIRYEKLLEGIKEVCRRVSYPYRPERIGRYKSGYRTDERHFGDYYERPAIEAVENVFGWELEYFGYGLGRRTRDQ